MANNANNTQKSLFQTLRLGLGALLLLTALSIGYMINIVDKMLYVPCRPKAKTYLNLPEYAFEFEKNTGPRLPLENKWIKSPYQHHRIQTTDTIQLDAWWVPAQKKTKKTIILAHGLRSSKHGSRQLYLAGMYHQAGFNVLLFDYRNHGYSSCPTHKHSVGLYESDDLLSVKSWVEKEKKIPSQNIGVHGISLGGLTAMIALYKDKNLAAVFAETPAYDARTVAASELKRYKVPSIISPIIISLEEVLMHYRLGMDVDEYTAKMGIDSLNNRPLMVLFAKNDTRVPYYGHFKKMILDAQTARQPLDIIILEGADHDGYMERMLTWYEKNAIDFFNKYLSANTKAIKVKGDNIVIRTLEVPATV